MLVSYVKVRDGPSNFTCTIGDVMVHNLLDLQGRKATIAHMVIFELHLGVMIRLFSPAKED